MVKKILLWIIAFIFTLVMAYYQRVTGPTYPVVGEKSVYGSRVSFNFPRSHGGKGDQQISIFIEKDGVKAYLYYKRYRVKEKWKKLEMKKMGRDFAAFLPHQPPAGKLIYFIEVIKNGKSVKVPDKPVVIRFKGSVPFQILLPHIVFMFLSLFFATRILLALFFKEEYNYLVYLTTIFLFIGGGILGPIVQKFAFGSYWTGVPFGWDLTDNKTLISLIFWIVALFFTVKKRKNKLATVIAIVVMYLVFLIPHSTLGSEYDYSKGKIITGNVEEVST